MFQRVIHIFVQLHYFHIYIARKLGKMGLIFSKFSPSSNPTPLMADTNQLFKSTHSFWASYASAVFRKTVEPCNLYYYTIAINTEKD